MNGCAGNEPFALRVLGDSMEPEFKDGEVIIVEPLSTAEDKSYVIALYNDEYFFRQLSFNDDRWHLAPLNDNYPTFEIDSLSVVRGRVISKSSGKGRQTKSYL